ncbi:MAG: carbohydrate kinase family protein [Firmicutes bacterium]|nr:carbohydrate kinase family protein [[Eubacterium] siraeum]MCM1487587.1 carbohydrate kinase family protein [Bacillota bacterium]
MKDYIYLYGQIISTESFLLYGDFPEADGYGEIKERYHLVGGETGTAAVILSSLDCPIKLGGTHIGNINRKIIRDYFSDKNADITELRDEDFEGVKDYVIIDSATRTAFGEWQKHYSRKKPYYEPPCEESIKNAVCCGIDPYFYPDISAKICVKWGKPYVTIDCGYDSAIHKGCAVNVVSHQYLREKYRNIDFKELFRLYTDNTDGLVIFTQGEKEVIYGRRGQPPRYFKPYNLDVVSTLGAGDSFKAGTIYALYNKMTDDDTVKYASAIAGVACTKFPIAKKPPVLSEIRSLIESERR